MDIPVLVLKSLLNPSYLYYGDDLIISWRLATEDEYHSSESCRVVWIKKGSTADNLGMGKSQISDFRKLRSIENPAVVLSEFPHVDIVGCEDLRLFAKSFPGQDSGPLLMAHFARRVPKRIPEIQTCYSLLRLEEKSLSVSYTATVDTSVLFPRKDQKNWVHFDYNGSLSFATQIYPKQIVFLPQDSCLKGDCIVRPHSMLCDNVNLDPYRIWTFGEIRGGTSAVPVNDGERLVYLSFFHSSLLSNESCHSCPRTYAMGAMLFSAAPPFETLRLSRIPIVHRSMYTGEWHISKISYEIMDYIVFPMSFIVQKQYLFLLYGFQDRDGWGLKINSNALLGSLVALK
jgi:hypothetical protein